METANEDDQVSYDKVTGSSSDALLTRFQQHSLSRVRSDHRADGSIEQFDIEQQT